jgi:SHS2 domain-containing protein
MVAYRFLEDIAIADVAFEAEGRSLSELFEACALATFAVMADLDSVPQTDERTIRLREGEVEALLFDWLAELIHLKDAEAMVFSKFAVAVGEGSEGFELLGRAWGAPIDPARMRMRADVKAPTYHMFEIQRRSTGWWARIVLDI